jgi:Subtilase family
MQPMDNMKMDMHDTFWRDDQVMIVFHSDIPLISDDGVLNRDRLLQDLNLPLQLVQIIRFLNRQLDPNNQNPIRLTFLDERDTPMPDGETGIAYNSVNSDAGSTLPRGVYLIGLHEAIQKDFGEIRTSIFGFFHLIQEPVQGDSKNQNNRALVPIIVNTLNKEVPNLNKDGVRIEFATPTWLCGGSQVTNGCPLTPPAPVQNECAAYHYELSDPDGRLPTESDEVTVFILDAIPERVVIANAAHNAGSTNGLLHNVNETVRFDYSQMSGVQGYFLMQHTNCAAVGKDIYGEHYPMLISDHGLFIAGIVRDIVPDANIECIRVLNDLCVGDMQALLGALTKIYNRVLSINPDTNQPGDLFDKPVVINLSLVIPTDDQAQNSGITLSTIQAGLPTSGFDNILPEALRQTLQSLADAGVIIAASAGNEGDGREMPAGALRPNALYPASLSDSIENVISVGAVTKNGAAASYSCYPGLHSIGAWGGELPAAGEVVPPNPGDPGSDHPQVTFSDAPIGIYSSILYPPLSAVPAVPPEQYYTPPNHSAWAYWIGTSFATPVVSAVAARILQQKKQDGNPDSVYTILKGLIPSTQVVQWDHLDPNDGTADGPLLRVEQNCSCE